MILIPVCDPLDPHLQMWTHDNGLSGGQKRGILWPNLYLHKGSEVEGVPIYILTHQLGRITNSVSEAFETVAENVITLIVHPTFSYMCPMQISIQLDNAPTVRSLTTCDTNFQFSFDTDSTQFAH